MTDAAPDRRRPRRDDFPWRTRATLRWRDEDAYGHVNNVVYMEYFDTAVALWLRERGGLDVPRGPIIGLVVETNCRYFAELSFPETVEIGLAVESVGRTSAVYRLALFGRPDEAAATCRFVHVYVDRAGRRPAPLPDTLRAALLAASRA